jgi:RNA polymerase sigma-70 factor (ECF subfamily)
MVSATPTRDERLAEFRPQLLAVAYRMLGSVADAEDAVQDAYLRYHEAAAREAIASPEGWLVKAATRRCIDRLRQAKRRAEYHGPWLPEPVPASWDGAAGQRAELAESLSMAFLLLLETLSPAERAAYLLREAFGYEFDEIASLLDKTPTNVRQIMARARKRLDAHERRFEATREQAERVSRRFFAACASGDQAAIKAVLADDVTSYSDGGGKVFAAPRPLHGPVQVSKLLSVVFRKYMSLGQLEFTTINGQPGAVFYADGQPLITYSVATDGAVVRDVYIVLNPDKLALWDQAAAERGSTTPAGPAVNRQGRDPLDRGPA